MSGLRLILGVASGLMDEGGVIVAEKNILYDRLVPVDWPEITTILVSLIIQSRSIQARPESGT